jgi:membrane-bound lytic murein transglycosylase D
MVTIFVIFHLLAKCFLFSFEPPAKAILPKDTKTTNFQQIRAVPIPEKLTFAGEEVPLDNEDVRERLERELIHNTYKLSAMLLILKREGRWRKMMQDELKANDVPEDFFYLSVAESELDVYAMSAVGAHGFWQFMRTTGKEHGLEISEQVDQRRDVQVATQAACKYLKTAYKKFGNWTLVAASYNRGMTGMEKAVLGQQQNSYYELYLNQETYRYIFRILALKVIMESPETYGFHLAAEEKYKPFKTKQITVSKTIADLASFAKENNTSYKTIKKLNAWLDDNDTYKLVVTKKTYTLLLPE